MRLLGLALVAGATGACAFVACAFPEFHYRGENATSSKASSSVASTGGASGVGGKGASSSTGGAGVGGAGGAMGGWQLGKVGACKAGEKCTITNLATGTVGCGKAGPKTVWHTCTEDVDCVDGTWCDVLYSVCKPICGGAGDCQFAMQGDCVPALDGKKAQIGKLKICTPNCDPKTAAPCDAMGHVTCIIRGTGTDCAKSGDLGSTQPCKEQQDCAPGYVCINGSGCALWCKTPGKFGGEFGSFGYCYSFDPKFFYNMKELGSCG